MRRCAQLRMSWHVNLKLKSFFAAYAVQAYECKIAHYKFATRPSSEKSAPEDHWRVLRIMKSWRFALVAATSVSGSAVWVCWTTPPACTISFLSSATCCSWLIAGSLFLPSPLCSVTHPAFLARRLHNSFVHRFYQSSTYVSVYGCKTVSVDVFPGFIATWM